MASAPPLVSSTPPAAPAAAPAAPETPPAAPETPPSGGDRPEWLPEALWKEGKFDAASFETLQKGQSAPPDLPTVPDAYTMPAIEGFDAERAKDSPIFATLRAAAFEAKVGQAGFDGLIKTYVDAETKRNDEFAASEMKKLGDRASSRIKAVETWMGQTLKGEEYAALAATLTTAASISAVERIMAGATTTPRVPTPEPGPVDDEASINKLMQSDGYRGGPRGERDPAIVKRVEDYFKTKHGTEKK